MLLEKAICGGQILVADMVENFPGFPKGIKGPELAERFLSQAKEFGLKIITEEALSIKPEDSGPEHFAITLPAGKVIASHTIVIATGAKWNSLNIPGEKKLTGKGISYCATCDGPLFRDKEVIVVGGGDTALEDALFLTKFARKVTVVHRRGRLRAAKILQERALNNKRIELCLESTAAEIIGDDRVEAVRIKNVKSGADTTLKADGVFVLIGITPNSDIVKGLVKTDEAGYIITDDGMQASVKGIFAAGDVRKKTLRQVVTAASEGAIAAVSVERYVEEVRGTAYK
jgi:thioredoxin reductase (NADPH)